MVFFPSFLSVISLPEYILGVVELSVASKCVHKFVKVSAYSSSSFCTLGRRDSVYVQLGVLVGELVERVSGGVSGG